LADDAGGECLRDIHRSDASLREPDCHTTRGIRTRTVPFDPLPPLLLSNRGRRLATKTGEFSIFHWAFCNSARSWVTAILPRFHVTRRLEVAREVKIVRAAQSRKPAFTFADRTLGSLPNRQQTGKNSRK
jgi:hypothetical protein